MSEQLAIESQEQSNDRLRRFAEHTGLEIADHQQRLQALASLESEQFIDLLSVGAGILRGEKRFSRWDEDTAEGSVVQSAVMGEDLVPPEESHKHFAEFFNRLKDQMAAEPEAVNKYAVELYFAIVGSHMFPDGNGRVARTMYHLVKDGKLPSEQAIFTRTPGVSEASKLNNQEAVKQLLDREGLSYKYINDFQAREDYDPEVKGFQSGGLSQTLKYIAAKRVLESSGAWDPDNPPKLVGLKKWSETDKSAFTEAYKDVRDEWFYAYIDAAAEYEGFYSERLSEPAELPQAA